MYDYKKVKDDDNDDPTQHRSNIKPGMLVEIVLKEDQSSGKLTKGKVQDLLTSKEHHPRGVKVRLESGDVGRVQFICDLDSSTF